MAVTAKFQADFSGFIAAIDKADVKLVDFSKGANKVEASLNRMVDNFSGRKMIQEAGLMTIAIDKAGGISKLTAKEIEQVGARANEAADKLKRLGYEVPAGLQKLADSTKTATSGFSDMKSVVGSLLGAFGVTFSIGAVVSFGKEVFAAADALQKLKDVTGISTQGLQKFQIAGDDAGNTLDQITAAIVKMEDKLAGGDASAMAALSRLGLSFEDIKAMTPENQFIAISEAIQKIKDPAQQVNIAIDLFGKAGASVLPTLKRGFADLQGQVVGMSDDTIATLDGIGDAMARLARSTQAIAGSALAKAWKAFFDPFGIGETKRELDRMTDAATNAAPRLAQVAQPNVRKMFSDLEIDIKNDSEALKKVAVEAPKTQVKIELLGTSTIKLSDANKAFVISGLPMVGLMRDLSIVASAHVVSLGNLEAAAIRLNVVETATGAIIGGTVIPMFSKLPNVVAQSTDAIKAAGEQTGILVSKKDGLGGLVDAFAKLAQISGTAFGGIVKDIAQVLAAMDAGTKSADAFMKALRNTDDAGNRSIDWGGMTVGAVGMVGAMDQATRSTSRASATLGGMATGMKIGMQVAGPYGAVIGAAAGALVGYFRSAGAAERETNKLREAMVQSAGGLAELNEKAAAAGVTLDKLLQAKNPKDYKIALDALTKAFTEQERKVKDVSSAVFNLMKVSMDMGIRIPDSMKAAIQKLIEMKLVTGDVAEQFALLAGNTDVDFKKMQEIAEKYGIALEDLGPAFQSARLGDIAKSIINDFDVLVRGGADVDKVLAGMKKPINDLVNESIKFGTKIPENMRPWIEQLIKTGQLTDANGDKIEDLSQIQFGAPIVSEFEKVIQKLQELIDKIGATIGGINAIPRDVTIGIHYDDPGPPSPRDEDNRNSMVMGNSVHKGGRVLTFQSGRSALGSAGSARITSSGGIGSGMSTNRFEAKIDKLIRQIAVDAKRLPERIKIATAH